MSTVELFSVIETSVTQKKHSLFELSVAILIVLGIVGMGAVGCGFQSATEDDQDVLRVERYILPESNIVLALKPASLVETSYYNDIVPAFNDYYDIPGFATGIVHSAPANFAQRELSPSEFVELMNGELSESVQQLAFEGKPYTVDEYKNFLNNGYWSEDAAKGIVQAKFEEMFKLTKDLYSRCDFIMLQFNDEALINSMDSMEPPQGMLLIVSFKEKQNFITLLKDFLKGDSIGRDASRV